MNRIVKVLIFLFYKPKKIVFLANLLSIDIVFLFVYVFSWKVHHLIKCIPFNEDLIIFY